MKINLLLYIIFSNIFNDEFNLSLSYFIKIALYFTLSVKKFEKKINPKKNVNIAYISFFVRR